MTQQATPRSNRRKDSVSEKDSAAGNGSSATATTTTTRSQTPSRQHADKKNANVAVSNGPLRGKSGSTSRSSSIPKQRGKSAGGSNNSSASLAPPPSRYDVAMAKMKKQTEGKSDDELQLLLQQFLQSGQFEDAAYLIAASASLSAKFKTSDVVRLMLDAKQFDQTAQLIRDMKLQSNQLLVTLFIKEHVRSAQFHAAVRYAQEMVLNFGKKDFGPRDQERPSWTPQALIQAMFRAQQFKTALKFSKQFELLDAFPVLPLVASMFEARQWEDAISSVMEYRLFTDFPVEALIMKMLGERQWTLAVKCMGKVQTKDLLDKYADALVREAARMGDFVIAIRYLNEYKLDQNENKMSLLTYLIDCMINYGEMYKAIKYSIKFGLDKNPEDKSGNGAVQTASETPYDTKKLIRKAIEIGQYHVATLYIKKLRLKEHFVSELREMEQKQQGQLREFREFVRFREAQFSQIAIQQQLYALLGDTLIGDADMVELEPVIVDVVVSEAEEIIPRKKKTDPEEEKCDENAPNNAAAGSVPAHQQFQSSSDAKDKSPQSSERQSRFNFARTSVPDSAPPGLSMPSSLLANEKERMQASAPPPGLSQVPQVAPPRAEESSSSFNFAQFASSIQQASGTPSAPGMTPPQPQVHGGPGPQHIQPNHQFAHQAPVLNGVYSRGPLSSPPPQAFPSSYHQGYMQSINPGQGQLPPPSYMMPPAPAPPQRTQGVNSPSMDIAALAMQFHSVGAGRGFGAPGFGNNSSSGAYPPQMSPLPPPPAGVPGGLNHLFPSFAPPPPPPQFAPPPRSTFKPSIGYTSVTTTVKRK
ncbi:hypothetical protein FI667_g11099, partial [Globisporangium splendens]